MKLAINLDALAFVNPDNPTVASREVLMRRGDTLPLEVIFFKDGERFELEEGSTLSAQINVKGTFGGSGLASAASATKSGTGVDSVYSLDVALTGAAVGTAFTNAGDPSSIDATLELKIAGSTYTQRTAPLAVLLQNAINQS